MSKNKNRYSIIEGCIRQSMNLPINKEELETGEPRIYKDENMFLYSPFKNDHDFMDRREKDKYKNKKMPWEKNSD